MKELEQKELSINKATAKVITLQFDIADYKQELKSSNGRQRRVITRTIGIMLSLR